MVDVLGVWVIVGLIQENLESVNKGEGLEVGRALKPRCASDGKWRTCHTSSPWRMIH